MRILNLYPKEAEKLYHRKPGDVLCLTKNDDSMPDNDIYMVLKSSSANRTRSVKLVSLLTGQVSTRSVSCRCVHHKKATLLLTGLERGECE